MSVVTSNPNNRFVFCEGVASSADISFWKRVLIDDVLPEYKYRIQIVPMGGKHSAQNFARGYTANGKNWRIIRDRDLDAENSKAKPIQWNQGKQLLTGFTCLESYMLNPELLRQCLDHYNLTKQNPTDHHQTVQQTVSELKSYQVIRWALQRLRKQALEQAKGLSYKRQRDFDLANRLSEKDGKLPEKLDFATCEANAIEHVETFRILFDSVSIDDLQRHIQDIRTIFNDTQFDYRYWYHGKDVLAYWLNHYSVKRENFMKFVVEIVDWQQYAAIKEIQRICQVESITAV